MDLAVRILVDRREDADEDRRHDLNDAEDHEDAFADGYGAGRHKKGRHQPDGKRNPADAS
jgi:hypothetical protein